MSLSRLVMMSLVTLTLSGPALAQQENHTMAEGMSDGHMMNGSQGDMMPMMREHMKQMQQHMEQMQQHMEQMSEANTQEERSAMMQEHMHQMQKHMQMMQQTMDNMHGGGEGMNNMQGEEHRH